MAGGILSIATSGLNAFQRGLDVTSNNIVNQGTRGYSRQTIHYGALPSLRYAGGFVGTGVSVQNIMRNSDQFVNSQLRSTSSAKTQYDTFYQQALQVESLLSNDTTSMSGAMQRFFSALDNINNNPDNLAARNAALAEASTMVEQFNRLNIKLEEYRQNSSSQIREALGNINKITKNIAAVNAQMSASGNAPELLDQRDELVRQLSEYASVAMTEQSDGTVVVSLANGEPLVVGSDQFDLSLAQTPNSVTGSRIALRGGGGGLIDITDNIQSGMLGGLLDYETNVIGQASMTLGLMAIGLSETFNAQHRLGMDLNNELGRDFFTDFNQMSLQTQRSIPSSNNTGTASLSVELSDIAQLRVSDYTLVVSDTGTNEVRLIRKSDGSSTTLNWTDNPPAPPAGQIELDGMTIRVDNIANLANDDQFTLTPTKGAAGNLNLNIQDASQIALASAVRTTSSVSNLGTGSIKLGTVLNTTDVQKEFRVEFLAGNQYQLVNVTDSITTGPFAFTPNENNTIDIPDGVNPSYSVVISGAPRAGDTFNAQYNAGGFADNGNGLQLGKLNNARIFSGGTQSVFDRYAGLIAETGSRTYQANLQSQAANTMYQAAVNAWESKSGVNLDEEAANLIRFQQAYQATSQLMAVANQLMDVLFAAMR